MRIDSFKARSCAGSNRKVRRALLAFPRIGNTLRRKSQRVVHKIAAYTAETTLDGNALGLEKLSTLVESSRGLAVKLLMAGGAQRFRLVIVNRYG